MICETYNTYRTQLIEKTENVIKQMRWKTLFYLRGGNDEDYREETNHGNMQTKRARPIRERRGGHDQKCQIPLVNKQPPTEMRIDIDKVRKSDEILVNADKTRNICCVKGPVNQTAWR